MVGGQQQANAIGAHLVGGLKASDAETAIRTACRILGRHLYAVTDGETGERAQWITWQFPRLTAVEGVEFVGTRRMPGENPDYDNMPALAVDPAVTELPALGYADAARDSYAVFRRLREEGVVPAEVKFQVSVPTAYANTVNWIREADQPRFFTLYAHALAAEVEVIVEAIAPPDLVIQYDVAVEVGVLSGALTAAPELAGKQFIVDALVDALTTPGGDVERGLHLCYGDRKHRHFAVPQDLSLCVELANGVAGHADFVHMPADRETGRDPRYYEPLRDLNARRLALGVIDYEGDEERTAELVTAAATGGGIDFAVATECGMARIDERRPDAPSLEQLLDLHARFAVPIR